MVGKPSQEAVQGNLATQELQAELSQAKEAARLATLQEEDQQAAIASSLAKLLQDVEALQLRVHQLEAERSDKLRKRAVNGL